MLLTGFRAMLVVAPAVGTLALLAPAQADEPSGLAAAAAIQSAVVDVIAQAEKSIVAIARVSSESGPVDVRPDMFGRLRIGGQSTPGEQDFIPNEYGTGVVVDASGLILTAHHVLRDGSNYYITTHDRQIYPARVQAADPRSDLAVLKIDTRGLPPVAILPIKMGDARTLKKGQIVIALGNPYAIARDGQASASWGIVSNLLRKDGPVPPTRDVPGGKATLHQYGTLIQTDAKLNLGTSGGALVNLSGEMVGLTVALSATLAYEQAAGFAIPVDDTFKRVLARLKEGREAEYGFLGVSIHPLRAEERTRVRNGVGVEQVVPGTPAQEIGLQVGDILTHVGRQEILDADHFMLTVGALPANGRVQLTWQRDGRVVSREIELAKFWVPGKKIVTNPSPAWRGLRVDIVTAVREFRDAALQGRIDARGSVVIAEVEQDSPAWKEGLRPDMMISHVSGRQVRNPREFLEAVADEAGPVRLRLVLPNGERQDRTIGPDAS